MKILRFESTPNPNAVKCILDRSISDRPRSFLNADAASDDALATEIFALGGVRNVLVNGEWISVNKLDDADWTRLKPALKRLIREFPEP